MSSSVIQLVDRLLSTGIIKKCILVFSTIAGVILFLMMMLTAADVTLRYFFDMPVAGAYELTQFAMVIFAAGGLSYCAMVDGHVSVDLFFKGLPDRTQAVITCLTKFISLIIVLLMSWRAFQQMIVVYGFGEKSQVLSLPVFPFLGITGLGIALFGLVLLFQFIESLFTVIRK